MGQKIVKTRILFILLTFISFLLIHFFIDFIANDKKQEQLDLITQRHIKSFDTVNKQLQQLTAFAASGVANLSNLGMHLHKIQTKTNEIPIDQIREKVYLGIENRYKKLKTLKLDSINIVMPDSKVFLMMKNPERFGHEVPRMKVSMHHVNKIKKPFSTFEISDGCTGFKYIYPIFYNKEYVGAMAFNFDASVITAAMMKDYYVLSNFLTRSEFMSKEFLENTKKFKYHPKNKEYLYNIKVLKAVEKVSRQDIKKLRLTGKTLQRAFDIFDLNRPATIYAKNLVSTITSIPIVHKLSNEVQGVISIRAKGDTIKTIENNYKTIEALLMFLAAIIYLLLYVLYQKYLKEKERMKGDAYKEKMVSLGEMIGNISHQWRQPLSLISTGSSGMKVQKQAGVLSDEEFYKICDAICDNAQYLSNTIDDFKNFIKGERDRQDFNLADNIETFLNLVDGTIKSNNIQIKKDIQKDIIIQNYPNELLQCFINIFNNSKDVLINFEEEKLIFITAYLKKDKVYIIFKDNGGGIPGNVISRIFEPYFTTKHQSQGTGLGLSMTYNLIVDGMHGNIDVQNKTYKYQEKKYTGAEFRITLPLR